MEKTMAVSGAGARIQSELSRWEGIHSAPHRFGGVEFKLRNREIGHIHGDSLVDVPLPKRVRDELVASGEAQPHHVLPQSGWVSVYLNDATDIDRAIRALRRSYELAKEQSERRATRDATAKPSHGSSYLP
jgi:predicted DNA-binding protein (MmcQ/YjbR family)